MGRCHATEYCLRSAAYRPTSPVAMERQRTDRAVQRTRIAASILINTPKRRSATESHNKLAGYRGQILKVRGRLHLLFHAGEVGPRTWFFEVIQTGNYFINERRELAGVVPCKHDAPIFGNLWVFKAASSCACVMSS